MLDSLLEPGYNCSISLIVRGIFSAASAAVILKGGYGLKQIRITAAIITFAFLLMSLILSGCGGGSAGGAGSGGASQRADGRLTVVLPFPEGNQRSSPPADLSYYVISVLDGGTGLVDAGPLTVYRPDSGTITSVVIENLPTGLKRVVVKAYTGSGILCGEGSSDVTILAGENPSVEIAIVPVEPPALVSITVTPDSVQVQPGASQQFNATGLYDDGSSLDITGSVTWSCDNDNAGRIAASGIFTAVSKGTFPQVGHISASLDGIVSGQATVTVTPSAPTLTSIDVSPASVTLVSSATWQFTATGNYSDGSSQDISTIVTWSCDDTSAGFISSSGLFTAVYTGSPPGNAHVQAALYGITSNQASVTINISLASISLLPSSVTIVKGGSQQFTATGHYTGGPSADISGAVKWQNDNSSAGAIDSSGLFTTATSGTFPQTAHITAIIVSVTSGQATVTIVAPGTLKWSFSTGGQINTTAALADDGTLYFGADNQNLYALDSSDGSQKWVYSSGGRTYGCSPAIATDGTVYFGSRENRRFHAINPVTGLEDWGLTLGGSLESAPSIGADGTIYLGCYDGRVYAINPVTHLSEWSTNIGTIWASSPAIASDGTIYCGSISGNLYALRPNGSIKWTYPGGIVDSIPAIGADGTIYFGSSNRNVYAVNPDGSPKWSYATSGIVINGIAIGPDGTVYAGSCDSCLYALDPDNGSRIWTFEAGDWLHSSPAIAADGTIYIGCDDRNLYAIDSSDGSVKWSYLTGGIMASCSPTIGPDGTVYIGSFDGTFRAIYGTSPPADSPWPMYKHDQSHTSRSLLP